LVLYFFRDPDRNIIRESGTFYSPGDGVISDIAIKGFDGKEYLRIGIFLSVFDVHVQRAPITGQVSFVEHNQGKNHPAFDPAASIENDQIVMGIHSEFGLVIVKQIAGILARKCVNYAKKDDLINMGQRYGLIKFGSRVELYLPKEVKVLCEVGEKTYGGITALAEMSNE
jgi:phosphatidylserine decarboxylase